MLQFYRDHIDERFLDQFKRKLIRQGKPGPDENLSQLVREMVAAVPWGHHANALAKLSDLKTGSSNDFGTLSSNSVMDFALSAANTD
jgi:hypothetical protein